MRTCLLSLRWSAGLPSRAAAACMKCGGVDVSLIAFVPVAPTTWRRGLATCQRATRSSFISCCRASQRTVFVRFQPTPNDACYKFHVDQMQFLPPNAHTMVFNSTNSYLSPLAHTLLEALPMVEEVTVGTSFVTVKRVEEADAAAAAHYFAMKFNRVRQGHATDESDAAARAQALQQHVANVLKDDDQTASEAAGELPNFNAASPSPSVPPADAPIDVGGLTVSPSLQDEQVDEAAVKALIAETDWSELTLHVSALLTDHICSGNPHVDPSAPHPHNDTVPKEGDSEVVLMIKELVSTTIRPQLQDDGGDLRFVGFDPILGDMHVELLGACRTCKSSKTTLVDLIERTTRHWIPEVRAVKDASRATSVFDDFVEHRSKSAAAGATDLSSSSPADHIAGEGDDGLPNGTGTVHFSPSPTSVSASTASGSYKIVRKVQASSSEAGTACYVAAPS